MLTDSSYTMSYRVFCLLWSISIFEICDRKIEVWNLWFRPYPTPRHTHGHLHVKGPSRDVAVEPMDDPFGSQANVCWSGPTYPTIESTSLGPCSETFCHSANRVRVSGFVPFCFLFGSVWNTVKHCETVPRASLGIISVDTEPFGVEWGPFAGTLDVSGALQRGCDVILSLPWSPFRLDPVGRIGIAMSVLSSAVRSPEKRTGTASHFNCLKSRDICKQFHFKLGASLWICNCPEFVKDVFRLQQAWATDVQPLIKLTMSSINRSNPVILSMRQLLPEASTGVHLLLWRGWTQIFNRWKLQSWITATLCNSKLDVWCHVRLHLV